LPSNDRVGLDVQQGTAPAGPQAAKDDPKQPIQARQNGTFTLSLEGRKLESQGSILAGNGLVTTQKQPNESNKR
jgi:hypothetical protein